MREFQRNNRRYPEGKEQEHGEKDRDTQDSGAHADILRTERGKHRLKPC